MGRVLRVLPFVMREYGILSTYLLFKSNTVFPPRIITRSFRFVGFNTSVDGGLAAIVANLVTITCEVDSSSKVAEL